MTKVSLSKLLTQAYKKLKSHLYTDKTLLCEKIEIAQFEQDLDKNLKSLQDLLLSKEKNISRFIKEISYTLVSKSIKLPDIEDNFYTNQTIQETYDVESFNIFIKAPIEVHLISTLWTMLIGEKLDTKLYENIKGNRLFRDKNSQFKNESYKLFRPFYEGYQSFRDEAIDMATYLHRKKLDVTVLNIDIQEFYYNIDFEFSSISDITPPEYSFLNDLMQQIHNKFHASTKTLKPKKGHKYTSTNFLPIGLVSSSVIANYTLSTFDEDIVQNLKPEYYSRYVDDMLFVFSNADVDLNSQKIVEDLITNSKFKKSVLTTKNETTTISTQDRTFKLQNKKVRLFHFDKDDSISLLEKFKENIDQNSSFFNFMPDDEKLFKTLESSSYTMFYNDSENKLSSLIGTSKDTLKISRNLTGVLATVASAKFDKQHLDIYNKQITNVFSGHNIFELRLHWGKVFTYLYITKCDELFVNLYKSFYETINKLSNNRLVEDMQKFLENSVLFAVSANPQHFENVLVKKLEENAILTNTLVIENIRQANMFSSHLMTYPLINYLDFFDNGGWTKNTSSNFLTQNLSIKNIYFKINQKKIKNSPRYIHYHEIILFDFYRYLNSKKRFYSTNTKFISKLYNRFNGFDDTKNNTFPTNKNEKYIITKDKLENKDKLKIGLVSLKTSLKDIEASYVSSPNLSYKRVQEIFNILNKSIEKDHKVDLLIFPEVSIPYAWVHLLARFAKKNNIGIIFGVEHIKTYDNVISNYTCVMLPFNTDGHTSLFVNFEAKKHFAPNEKIDIQSRGFKVNENIHKKPTLYKYRGGVFSTFNCYELTDIKYRSSLVGEVDFVVAIEYNKDTNYFSSIIDSLSRDTHCYVVQVNTSDYGDSRIVQPSKTESKDTVKQKGGENIYLVVDTIDIKKLRDFQAKGHVVQKIDKSFKLVPPEFEIGRMRK